MNGVALDKDVCAQSQMPLCFLSCQPYKGKWGRKNIFEQDNEKRETES